MTSYDTLLAANAPGWAIADALEEEGRTELAELYRVPRLRLIEPLLDLLTGGYLVPERFYDDLNRLLALEQMPSIEVLAWIKTRCRSVFIGWDAACPDWQPNLKTFREQQVFDLTAAVDGVPGTDVDYVSPSPCNVDVWPSPC